VRPGSKPSTSPARNPRPAARVRARSSCSRSGTRIRLFAKVEAELFRRRYFSGELRQLAPIERLFSGQGEQDVVDVPGDVQDEQFVERFLVGADHRVVERVGGGAPDVADDAAARHERPDGEPYLFQRYGLLFNLS
jgi:hypothetical protein